MVTLVTDLELPELPLRPDGLDPHIVPTPDLADDEWLVNNPPFGYSVVRYEDIIGILRDKRWHSASGRIPELMGITREDFLERQQVSILSAEGDVHTRLRRLVAPAFSPRAADRLRPFMREVMNSLIDPVAAAGS